MYDDLISQGKSPEAAYRLAISGIGDINVILGDSPIVAIATSLMILAPSQSKDKESAQASNSPKQQLSHRCFLS